MGPDGQDVMDSQTMFDTAAFEMPAEPIEKLSATRRLTLRNQAMLEAGTHPATCAPLTTDPDRTCGNCAHAVHLHHHDRSYWKCHKHRLGLSASAASDIRVSWPGCVHHEIEELTHGT